jgi:hypothetical protein
VALPPTKEQYALRDDLHALMASPGWPTFYARGVDRMKLAQSTVMAEDTNHEKRANEVAVWNAIRKLIEWPQSEVDYITGIEERSTTE